jgi:DNA-binding beta-propeller fold protein YncE
MRSAAVLLLAVATLSCGGSGSSTCRDCGNDSRFRPPWPQGRPAGYVSPIPAENARAGDPDFRLGREGSAHQLEAYADHVSARVGQTVRVQVSVDAAHAVRWVLYRIGWYGGAGARRVSEGGPVTVTPQPACPPRAGDALVRCSWAPALQLSIGSEHVSGYYAVKLVRDDGFVAFAPFVVVDDRPADLLMQASVNTWQAYNTWGGESLYSDNSGTVPGGFALRVSFDRPYGSAAGLGASDDHELAFARFLERFGYDVSYTTDLDVALGGTPHLYRAGAFLSVGHDEYWAGANRDAVEGARDYGVPILFFGANAAYWKIRLEGTGADGAPRILTCFKSAAVTDPVTGPDTTGRFRDPAVNRPESALVGVAYESWQLLSFPLVVADGSSWLYGGTGLETGDALPGLIGNEYDVATGDTAQPSGLVVVARSPVLNAEGRPSFAAAGWYRDAQSHALVFGAGTIQWARGVDPHREAYDPRVERMTANVIYQALGLPVPKEIAAGGQGSNALQVNPVGPFARSVATRASGLLAPSGVAVMPDGTLAVVDPKRNQILRIDAAGAVSVIAGDGQLGRNAFFDDVPGLRARFSNPTAILALPDGGLLVADTGNACIRRVGDDQARTVTTFAGKIATAGFADGAPSTARFSFPMGLARDSASGVVYVADSANHRIRAIDPAGNVATLAGGVSGDADGPGALARFAYPTAVAVGPGGLVYVVASSGATVKVVGTDPAHTVTTLAGGVQGVADGPGNGARLGSQGGAVWAGGELLVSDPASYRIRAIVPGASAASTVVHTVAGSGLFGDAGGTGDGARFGMPAGLAVGPGGVVYVADPGTGTIRAIQP